MNENNLVCDPVMITPTKRVAVYHDQFANDPRRDGLDYVSMFPVKHNSRYVKLLPGDDHGIVETLKDVFSDWDLDDEEKYDAAVKILEKNNRVFIYREFVDHRDFVGAYLVWTNVEDNAKEFLAGYCKMIQQWINGEVYVVSLEEMHTYVDQSDPDKTITRWENVESVGDVYLNSFDFAEILEVAGVTV